MLNDKLIETAEELSNMEDIKNNDVVVLAHVQLKHTQVEAKVVHFRLTTYPGFESWYHLRFILDLLTIILILSLPF